MKILVKDNETFGGYVARVVNNDLTSVEVPAPLVGGIKYSNKNKDVAICLCRTDARIIFDVDDLEIIDQSKM